MTDSRVCHVCKVALAEGTVCAHCRSEEYERWQRQFDQRRQASRARSAGVVTLKLARRRPEMCLDGVRVPLTWQAWQLLSFLSDAPGLPVSNDRLCDLFRFPVEHAACNSSVLQVIHRTRKVLARAGYPGLIETVPGCGYRLRVTT